MDADRVKEEELKQYELIASGIFSLVENNLVDHPEGVLFCLKDLDDNNFEDKLKSNLLHPYSLVYITYEGEVKVPMRMGKRALDLFKKLSFGKLSVKEELLKQF